MATSLPSLPPLTGDTSWIDNPTGMEGLPTLIAPVRPFTSSASSPTTPSTAPQTGVLGTLNKAMNWADSITGAANADNPQGGQKSVLGISLEDLTFIIVGLILVAAAVFSFKAEAPAFPSEREALGIQAVKKVSKTAAEVAA